MGLWHKRYVIAKDGMGDGLRGHWWGRGVSCEEGQGGGGQNGTWCQWMEAGCGLGVGKLFCVLKGGTRDSRGMQGGGEL